MDKLSFSVVDAIKAAGSNPLALAAFIVLVVALVVVSLRVRRNKNLLLNLEKLPAKDRLRALSLEMGVRKIKGGLSPEQWLRHNSRQYIFGAVVVVCLTAIVLVAIVLSALHEPGPVSGAHIGLHDKNAAPPTAEASSKHDVESPSAADERPPPKKAADNTVKSTLRVRTAFGERQMAEQEVPRDREVTYQAALDKGVSRITYSAPYLSILAKGGPIEGFNSLGVPFRWRFPELSVTVANNTKGVMLLSEARVQVLESHVINDIVLLVEDLSVDRLVFRNEGWGEVVQPRVEFSILEEQRPGEIALFAPKVSVVQLASFADRMEVPLKEYLPDRLRDRSFVQAQGTIEYGSAGARNSVQFKTRVALQVRAAVGLPPTYSYDVFLDAGKTGITKQIGLAQEIKAGQADHFVLRLATNRTAQFRLRVTFVTADGTIIKGGDVTTDVFVPRTAGRIVPTRGP